MTPYLTNAKGYWCGYSGGIMEGLGISINDGIGGGMRNHQ